MNIEINELKLRELCKSLLLSVQDNEAQKILQENEIQSMFLLIAKLISIDGEIKVGELELLRTIALYLDINRKVWAESILNFKS
jgi:hypothetical protein